MANDNVWGKLVSLLKDANDLQVNHSVTGTLRIHDQDVLDSLRECLSFNDAGLEITSDEEFADLSIGINVGFRCYPRIGWGRIANDLDALLKTPKALIKEPRQYILLSPEFTAMSDKALDDSDVTRYRKVIELIGVIKESAAFMDKEEQRLVFINSGRFDIPVIYDADDILSIDLGGVEKIINSIPEGTHQKQCEAIMAEAIVSLTKSQPEKKRFKYLLEHVSDLIKRYEDGYQLFASGFSYEKVRDQVEAARIEYTGKIHKVLSDIQNQLLGIPVATVIVATQMKKATDISYSFWVNSAVLLGCWIFSVLMIFLLHNQYHTLSVIKEEVKRQSKQMESEFALIKDSFESVFSYLFKRICTQKTVLWVLGFFLASALIISHVIYFKLTPPAVEIWTSSIDFVHGLAKGSDSQ